VLEHLTTFTICSFITNMSADQEPSFSYRLEMWDDHDTHIEEVIALVRDHAVARAAFAEAVQR
jgi:hypothetical protein